MKASGDPALIVSLAWKRAHAAMSEHCLQQQKLETQLLKHGVQPMDFGETSVGQAGRGNSIRRAYSKAKAAEALASEQERKLLERLSQTPAKSLAGVAAKLSVIVQEAEDNTDLSDFPVAHVRSALDDLQRLMADATADEVPALMPVISADGKLEPSASSLAAWCALQAWSQADEKRYRIWLTAFRSLTDL